MSKITHIILHCSDSPFGSASLIRRWHTDPKPAGRGWSDIGYHFVIQNGRPVDSAFYLEPLDGQIECGRRLDGDLAIEQDEVGFHCIGHNGDSISVCMIGMRKDGRLTFTIKQFDALKALVLALCDHYRIPVQNVIGHCETESGKAEGKSCPDFDVEPIRLWLRGRVR